MLEGKLAVRSDATKHQGDFRKILEGFNLALDNVIKPLNMSAEYMDRISKGDIPPKITDTYQGDFNEVKNNLNVCIDAIGRLVTDGVTLTKAMLDGKLAVRADAAKHQGDFRKVIEGFNVSLDNVIKPLNITAEYMDRISKGDIPPKITDTYQGDFNEVKNNLNVCIDAIGRLVTDGVALTKAMLEGKLAVARRRGQAPGRFPQGDRGLQPGAGQRHQAAERDRRVHGPHLQGRHPAQDHRNLPAAISTKSRTTSTSASTPSAGW